MLTKLRTEARNPSPAFVIACLALFVALGGSSYAAVALKRNSVKNRHLSANSVTEPKVRDGSLLAQDFAPDQLPRGEKGEPGPPGSPNPNAQNSDLLDGLDSADFLRSNGKAADSEMVDGIDSTQLIQGANGRLLTFARAATAGNDTDRGGTPRWEAWYSCPNPTSTNGTVHFKNLGQNSTLNVFADNGSSNPVHTTLGPGQTHDEAASATGEAIEFDVQGYVASGTIVHMRVVTLNRPSDCHFQFFAAEVVGS